MLNDDVRLEHLRRFVTGGLCLLVAFAGLFFGALNGYLGLAIVTAAFAVLFAISGFFLWLGERDHRFIFDGTGTVHDALTLISVGLVSGHLYLSLIHPATRHALRGMTLGEVREDWAREHHSKWLDDRRGL